mmetsp:Transcript_75552/g.151862  ORF Transcript_75552/g.151862 Transcript_75552/m.151862 type:complete len:388 (-) Transcript_75552:156-1319(-)
MVETVVQTKYHVIDLSALPDGYWKLKRTERVELYRQLTKTYTGEVPAGVLTKVAPISFSEEAIALAWYSLTLGTPFFIPVAVYLLLMLRAGPLAYMVVSFPFMMMAVWPLSNPHEGIWTSRLMASLYKYSSYKVVYTDAVKEAMMTSERPPCIGSGGPHGVMPIGALLGISAVNEVLGVPFRGSAASAVFRVPGLRCFQIMGMCDVNRASILQGVKKGFMVGIVSDGIKGMFKATTSATDVEVLALKNSKGIAKLALSNDLHVVAVHWFGNSAALVPMVDPFGLMEALSRRLRLSLLLFRGRFYFTPMPTRQPIVMAIGDPIFPGVPPSPLTTGRTSDATTDGPPKKKQVTQKAIDEMHGRILSGHRKLYESLRVPFGWKSKELTFV